MRDSVLINTRGHEESEEFLPLRTLHHIGFVVQSIADVAESFAASISAIYDGRIIHDPIQRVYVTFLRHTCTPATALVELIAPASPDSPVQSLAAKGGGLHHLCYEVASLEECLQTHQRSEDLIVSPPRPAVAFQGRDIAWVFTKQRLLIEYLEQAK
jgi:methylmalonyl-CoA/ethylmalonyl-CoA epimerase